MTFVEENLLNEYSEEDVQASAVELSIEFSRDSRRYCRRLTTEVEE